MRKIASLAGKLEYDNRIFNPQTVRQMSKDYVQLLNLMTADPEKNFAAISQPGTAAVANLEL